MSDALTDRIKAHRSAPTVYDPPTFGQMADRIEELVKDLADGSFYKETTIDALIDRAEQAEAKLAKAVEALQWYADFGNYISGFGEYAPINLDKGGRAKNALAELGGKIND